MTVRQSRSFSSEKLYLIPMYAYQNLTFLSHNNVRKHQFLEKYQHFFKNVNIFWQNVDIFTILTVKYLLKDENHEKLLFLM